MEPEFLFTGILGLAALGLSLVNLWRAEFRRFDLDVSVVGRIAFTKDAWSFSPNSLALMAPAFYVDLLFANSGVRAGVVKDVALELKDAAGLSYLFRSFGLVTNRQLNLSTQQDIPPEVEPFSGFHLAGKESQTQRLWFVVRPFNEAPQLEAEQYNLNIWVDHSGSKKWQKSSPVSITLTAEDINTVNESNVQKQGNGFFVRIKSRELVPDSADKKVNELKDILAK